MNMRKIPGSDKPIFPIGLGCLQLTSAPATDVDPNRENSIAIVKEAYHLGVNLFDTADFYGNRFGENEEFLGKAFKALAEIDSHYREKCFISSKGGVEGIFHDGVHINNSHQYLVKACQASLNRLGIDYLDLYYLHRHDGKTSPEAIIDAMAELKNAGKIRLIGLSEVDPLFIAKAHEYAQRTYGLGIAAIQPEYSIASREIEHSGVLELCTKLGIAIIPYGSIGRGIITNRVNDNFIAKGFEEILPRFKKDSLAEEMVIRQPLTQIAKELSCTESQLSLSWLLQQYKHLIPIPATTNLVHLRENVKAINVQITENQLSIIDTKFPLNTFPPRYPNGFPETEMDAIWIPRYTNIQKKSSAEKIQMPAIRDVAFKALEAHLSRTLTEDSIGQIAKAQLNTKTITALREKNLSNLNDGILGGSLAVYDSDRQVPLVGVSGIIDQASVSTPINRETKYNVGSISKFILMTMVVRLCMLGKLDLDKTVSDYLPNIPEIPEASAITLRHLLSHHSGLRSAFFKKYVKSQPISDLLLEERAGRPGERFVYSNTNYVLIGKIIESVTKDTLANQLKILIVNPLRLVNISLIESDDLDSNIAQGYKITSASKLYKAEYNNYVWAASGFRASPSDLTILLHHFFNDPYFISLEYRQKVVDSIKEVMFEVVTKQATHRWPASYGMGIERHIIQDPRDTAKTMIAYGNGGWNNGSAIFLMYVPEQQVSVCYACSKTQGAQKLNLSKLTEGHFFKVSAPRLSPEEFVLAAHRGDLAAIKRAILKDKMDVNVQVDLVSKADNVFVEGTTALHEATAQGHSEVMKFMINHGAEVNKHRAALH